MRPDVRRRQLAQLHLAVKELGLDEETYRSWLQANLKVSSAKELGESGMRRALELLRGMGWSPHARPGEPKAGPQARKIWALWHRLARTGRLEDPSNAGCRAFVQRMTGVSDPRFLDAASAAKVIEGLKAWTEREEDAAEKGRTEQVPEAVR